MATAEHNQDPNPVQQEIAEMMARARAAQAAIEHYTQEQVDELITAMVWSVAREGVSEKIARFTVEETRGAWMRVTSENGQASGWLHESALTKKTVTLKAGEQDAAVTASSGELALAGKGFNSDVEAKFKEENKTADFKAVDRMEAIRITTEEILKFLKAGSVAPKGGAQ